MVESRKFRVTDPSVWRLAWDDRTPSAWGVGVGPELAADLAQFARTVEAEGQRGGEVFLVTVVVHSQHFQCREMEQPHGCQIVVARLAKIGRRIERFDARFGLTVASQALV